MRGRFTRFICSAAAILLAALGAPAEPAQQPGVGSGDRVRVTAPSVSEDRIEGNLTAVDLESLTVLPLGADQEKVTVPRSRITKLEVLKGKKSHAALGGLIGAAQGAAVGLFLSNPPSSATGFEVNGAAMAGSMAVGTAFGALVGALVRTDRWTTVPADTLALGVGRAPGGGVALGVRLSF